MSRFMALVAVAVLAGGCAGMMPAGGRSATARLADAQGQPVGTAVLNQVSGGVRIVMEVKGLPPGEKGVHLHAVGRCEPPAFTSAGGHFNPRGRQHGLQNPQGPHAGDLPNIVIGPDGTGRLEALNDRVTLGEGDASLFDADGTALVIHAAPDDHRTDPTGNSGARLACGVVVKG